MAFFFDSAVRDFPRLENLEVLAKRYCNAELKSFDELVVTGDAQDGIEQSFEAGDLSLL